ncbi:MAG TPA: PA14 domain-containing protein [Polyangiaceae bacterium]|nr:PA14 domain-containing protein [Polyangiaceae bacterium]
MGYSLYPLARAWNSKQATWNTAETGSAWAAGGAEGTSDRSATAVGALIPTAMGKTILTLNAAGIKAVQGWVTTPTINFGLVVDSLNDEDGMAFDSSSAAIAANRPQLTVAYTTPLVPAGTGLLGQYYSGLDFQTLVTSRTDSTINFNWGTGSPATGIPVDGFSVRWTGQVEALYTETYTFFTTSDDGARLWVNGQELVNNWTNHAATENSGTVALTAGQKYTIEYDYFENTGNAEAELSWSSASQAKQIVPAAELFPAAVPVVDAGTVVTKDAGGGGGHTGYGAGSAAVGTACVSPTVTVNPSMTTAAIQSAMNSAGSGGYVCFSPGIYRLTTSLEPSSGQTLHGALGAVLKGSIVLTGAVASGSNFAYSNVPLGNTGPAASVETWCEDQTNYPCAYYEDVFLDGEPLTRAPSLAAVTTTSFYTDYGTKTVTLGTNPAGHVVEMGNTPMAFQIGNSNVIVEGLTVEMFATHMNIGAIYFGGNSTGGIVRNSESFFNHANGVSTTTGMKLSYNRFHDNGQTGAGIGGTGVSVDHNDLVHNNIFGFQRNDGAEGGIKVDLSTGSTLTYNYVADNLSFGIYYDEDANGGLIQNNYVENNWASGINFVFSTTGTIASNIVLNNGLDYWEGRGDAPGSNSTSCKTSPQNVACLNAGIDLANASGTKVYSNVVTGNANGIALVEFTRDQSTVPWTIPVLENNDVHDNVITVGTGSVGVRQYGGPTGYNATTSNNVFANNTYHLVSLTGTYFWFNTIMAKTAWQAAGQDETGTFLSP